ncbi:MAG: helix-turn-helix domain-containing protein [Nocardioidaceae bacterium]
MPMSRSTPDPTALKALAHPVRLRLLGLLRAEGPSTASRLAERLGLNSGATSYHLRSLAQHGFIVDDAERGDGRDRWWRAAHQSTWTADDPSPQSRDAQDAFSQAVAVVQTELLQRALEDRPLLAEKWWRTTTLSDWELQLTSEDGMELKERLVALFEEFEAREPGPGEPTDGTAPLVYQIHAFPRPGTIAGDPA